MLSHFQKGLSEYGLRRLLTEEDFLLALGISSVVGLARVGSCYVADACISIYSQQFVNLGTQFAISLTAFILAGLAVLISFTDDEFLVKLAELNIYSNIMFVFQFNLYLAGATALMGIFIISMGRSVALYIVFMFLFIYMIGSITMMVDLIAQYGRKKAHFERSS